MIVKNRTEERTEGQVNPKSCHSSWIKVTQSSAFDSINRMKVCNFSDKQAGNKISNKLDIVNSADPAFFIMKLVSLEFAEGVAYFQT